MMSKIENKKKLNLKKIVFIILGAIFLGLGVVGIFLPVLPTTPFLLLTAYLWAKSSDRLYHWLLINKYFGEYIKRYREGLGIPLKTKILSVSTLWFTIVTSVIFFIPFLAVDILVLVVAVAVTYHILSKPTYKKSQNEKSF